MVVAIYQLKTKVSFHENLEAVLQRITNRTRYVPGCIFAEVWSNENRPGLMVFEQWNSDTSLDNHIRSSLFKQMLSAFELGDEMPEIQFYSLDTPSGIERIEKILLPEKHVKTA